MNIRLSAILTVGTPRVRKSDQPNPEQLFRPLGAMVKKLQISQRMGRRKFHGCEVKSIRDKLNYAGELAAEIQERENQLVDVLRFIDARRWFVHYGYKSLSGFCIKDLGFSRTQAQRIVTHVRRGDPTSDIADRPIH